MSSFRIRQLSVDEASHKLLKMLVAPSGYCTVRQAKSLLSVGPGLPVGARLRFLRRVTKYPVVYRITKATARLVESFRL